MLTSFKAKLVAKKLLVNKTYFFTFELVEPKEFSFIAGQYMMLKVPKGEGFLSRMYSIASPPTMKNAFELIVEIVPQGLGSTYLDNITIGQVLDFMGPGGVFLAKETPKKNVFLVTGTGIAPVRSMLLNGMTNYSVYWGMKTLKDIYLFEELKKFNVKICLSREENLDAINDEDKKYFDLGHVDKCFEKDIESLQAKNLGDYEFYLCGGRHIVESLRMELLEKNVPRENIHFEKF